jgi:hypothetical protein
MERIMSYAVDPTIAAWQADGHEVGMIAFAATETASEQFPYYELPAECTFLGLMEADALCLAEDGSVVVYDHEVAERVLCRAAPDQATFLAALAALEAHFEKCATDTAYWEDESAAAAVRERCTEIAGGEEYAAFYSMMVGA